MSINMWSVDLYMAASKWFVYYHTLKYKENILFNIAANICIHSVSMLDSSLKPLIIILSETDNFRISSERANKLLSDSVWRNINCNSYNSWIWK